MFRFHHIISSLMFFLMVFTSSITSVQQSWGDFAMPQRQSDVARTGLQAGDFGAFTIDGVVRETVITLQDLSSVPYNNEEIGPAQTHCPPNVSGTFAFSGLGVVQDDDLNVYATFSAFNRIMLTANDFATYTIKLSRSLVDHVYTPVWVTCTGNNDSSFGNFNYNPALYKDVGGESYVILRDAYRTQFAIRASDGVLKHAMVYDEWSWRGSVAVTPEGDILQPGDNSQVFITSTDEPLSGTRFTLTQDWELTGNGDRPILRTMGSPSGFSAFVTSTDENQVVFFNNLGQSTASVVYAGAKFNDIRELTGFKDGRVAVLHTDASRATLTILDYHGTDDPKSIVLSDNYTYPAQRMDEANVCQGADGNVYVLDSSCSLFRVNIDDQSSEPIAYVGCGRCDASAVKGANYLASNEEGVFFATSYTPTIGGQAIEVNGLQYGTSKIQRLATHRVPDGNKFNSGHLVPGAHVSLLFEADASKTSVNTLIAIAAFNVEDEDQYEGRDAAQALFFNQWMEWSF